MQEEVIAFLAQLLQQEAAANQYKVAAQVQVMVEQELQTKALTAAHQGLIRQAAAEAQARQVRLDKAVELAKRIATNAPLTNYALMHALPRIADQPADHGYFTEALMAGIAQDSPEAKARVKAFLEGKAAKVAKG